MDTKDVVLIIEDSPAIGMLLTEFMKKLGYSDVKIAETGETGVTAFRELVETKTPPLVFLDYNLPDSTAKSVMSQILTIKPDTKIIIETANSKDEDIIKEVIGLGAYHYIQKPIHFNDIKEIISILQEDTVSDDTSTDSDDSDDGYKLIDRYFNTYKRVSTARLLEQSQLSENTLSEYLKKLESQKNISSIDVVKELTCNSCQSLRLAQIFQCPSCKNSNFEQTKLIEHFDCGNFSEESTYNDDNKCPKCNKQIKALGVDYRILNNRYKCKNCEDIFQEVRTEFLCLKCSNSFMLDDGNWKESMEYKLIQTY